MAFSQSAARRSVVQSLFLESARSCGKFVKADAIAYFILLIASASVNYFEAGLLRDAAMLDASKIPEAVDGALRNGNLLNAGISIALNFFTLNRVLIHFSGKELVLENWGKGGFCWLVTLFATVVGCAALLIPGIWLLGRLYPAWALSLLEVESPLEESWILTRDRQVWKRSLGVCSISQLASSGSAIAYIFISFGVVHTGNVYLACITGVLFYPLVIVSSILCYAMGLRWARMLTVESTS